LEIIFGHHPIALGLGISREIAIFLVELGGVAARPVIDPIASFRAISGTITHLGATATAAATILPIIDQGLRVLVPGGLSSSPLPPASVRPRRAGHPGDPLRRHHSSARHSVSSPTSARCGPRRHPRRMIAIGFRHGAAASINLYRCQLAPVAALHVVRPRAKTKGNIGRVSVSR
jgi:hypothetical protein